MTWDSTFALGAVGLERFVLGPKTGWSLGSTSANPSPALVESLAGKFKILGLQRPPGAPAIHGGPLIIIAIGSVSVNPGSNMFEYGKRCRRLRSHFWSSTFHVMRVFLAAQHIISPSQGGVWLV
jgi:hypothetical protein